MKLLPRRDLSPFQTALPWLAAMLCAAMCSCVTPNETEVGGYPEAPPGVTDVIYVNSQASAVSPLGTIERPWRTIEEALLASESMEGAAVLIASGKYEEQMLTVRRPVHLVGGSLSSDGEPRVTVVGDGPVVLWMEDVQSHSADPGSGPLVTLQGITVKGGSNAIAVVSGEGVSASFQDCHFRGAVDWTEMVEGQKGPYGLVVKDGARVEMVGGEVSGSYRPGIMVQGGGLVVNGAAILDNEEGGIRVERGLDVVGIHGALIKGNREFGVGVYSSYVYVGNTTIEDNDTTDSDGIVAHPLEGHADIPTVVVAHQNTIVRQDRFGLFITDADHYDLWDNAVTDNKEGGVRLQTTPGHLRSTEWGTSILMTNVISNNSGSGVSVQGSEEVTLYCNRVQNTEASTKTSGSGGHGDGISVSGSSETDFAIVHIRNNQLSLSARYELFLKNAAGSCELANSAELPVACQHDDSPRAGSTSSPDEIDDAGSPVLGEDEVYWVGENALICESDWSAPEPTTAPPATMFPAASFNSGPRESGVGDNDRDGRGENDPGAANPPGQTDIAPEEPECGDGNCSKDEDSESCPDDCAFGADPAPSLLNRSHYGQSDCDTATDPDCDQGEESEDCESAGETDDLDALNLSSDGTED